MSARVHRWSRWAVVVGLLVAVGASIAAMNWYSTWTSFARLDAGSGRGGVSLATVESQANFQRWVLVTLVALVVAVAAMASEWLSRTKAADDLRRERLLGTNR
jgi:hypothetical protein